MFSGMPPPPTDAACSCILSLEPTDLLFVFLLANKLSFALLPDRVRVEVYAENGDEVVFALTDEHVVDSVAGVQDDVEPDADVSRHDVLSYRR